MDELISTNHKKTEKDNETGLNYNELIKKSIYFRYLNRKLTDKDIEDIKKELMNMNNK